ncbi:hypothetical protein Tco_0228464 [Tanacetum coccineum]
MEVEPLDRTKLEDLGLNTYSHDLSLSFREIPSVVEPEPQLLPDFSPLDVNLGDKRGTDPPINPYSSGSLKMKVVEPLTIHIPPSPHVAYFHRNDPGDGVRINLDGVARLYMMRRNPEVLRSFMWAILG